MTLLQLKYISECNRTNSISTAAAKLYTTVSNVSKLVKSLEEELGYAVFDRTPHGLFPTEKGRIFLQHAANILNEMTQLENLDTAFNTRSFTLASIPSTFCCLAFSDLAKKTVKLPGVRIRFNTVTSKEALTMLKNQLCDMAVIACSLEDECNVEHKLRHEGLHLEKVAKLGIVVHIAPDHPLLSRYDNDREILHGLMHYPYIEFNNDSFLSPHPIEPYMDKSNIIQINDRVWRLQLLRDTFGFTSGLDVPKEARAYQPLYKFYVPDAFMSIFCVTRQDFVMTDLTTEYVNILKERFAAEGAFDSRIRSCME